MIEGVQEEFFSLCWGDDSRGYWVQGPLDWCVRVSVTFVDGLSCLCEEFSKFLL